MPEFYYWVKEKKSAKKAEESTTEGTVKAESEGVVKKALRAKFPEATLIHYEERGKEPKTLSEMDAEKEAAKAAKEAAKAEREAGREDGRAPRMPRAERAMDKVEWL